MVLFSPGWSAGRIPPRGEHPCYSDFRKASRAAFCLGFKCLNFSVAFAASPAWRAEALDAPNPMDGVACPRGAPSAETEAYTLEEIQRSLAALSGVARTVVAVAAFTGLRKSELRGLRWEDVGGGEIHVVRAVWGRHVGETKTRASRAPIPLLPFVARVLEEYTLATGAGAGYVFAASNAGPLHLDNLAGRAIAPTLRAAGVQWRGWHAYRRGLATNLHLLGVDDRTIQAILRHSSAATTRAWYIKTSAAEARAAMDRLERVLGPMEWATKWATPRSGRGT